MVEVRKCSWLEFSAYREFPALLDAYARECAIEGLPAPKADERVYLMRERTGMQHVLVATLDDALVGFLVLLNGPNAHYSAKIGVAESFFVAPEHRKSGAGLALRQAAEELAASDGAVGFLICAPLDSKLARVMERDKGYRETNRVFFRSLPCTATLH